VPAVAVPEVQVPGHRVRLKMPQEYSTRPDQIDVDKTGPIAAHFGVKYLPTSIIFEHGKETSRFVGSKDSAELALLLGGPHER
jgi:hypothetical protein